VVGASTDPDRDGALHHQGVDADIIQAIELAREFHQRLGSQLAQNGVLLLNTLVPILNIYAHR